MSIVCYKGTNLHVLNILRGCATNTLPFEVLVLDILLWCTVYEYFPLKCTPSALITGAIRETRRG